MECTPKGHVFPGHGSAASCCPPHLCTAHPQFMSKKKRIEMLKKKIEMLKERIEDIEEYISELGGK